MRDPSEYAQDMGPATRVSSRAAIAANSLANGGRQVAILQERRRVGLEGGDEHRDVIFYRIREIEQHPDRATHPTHAIDECLYDYQ